ncbi:cytochrome c551 [Niallia endozanthoxylica]|uniref:Cytochrome c n=1 Tax=Niallia endozanthoxylica TaxID=2036016 RepID=A0A5J5HFP4_9BACI|nr:cytochrome c [Niallia endozanthoxylica]KAA9018332.1 cytochrome c [Niallia endozanthoxylica]
MKKCLYGVVFVAFLSFISACGDGDEATEQENAPTEEQAAEEQAPTADAGEPDAKYQQSCSQCHGGDLVSGGAPDLNMIGSKYSQDEILEIIENGRGNMPGGLLTGEDAEAVASWLAEQK